VRLIAEKGKREIRARDRRKRMEGGNRARSLRIKTAVIATLYFIHTETHHHLLIPKSRFCGIPGMFKHSKTGKIVAILKGSM
jgi:hypothetical protein